MLLSLPTINHIKITAAVAVLLMAGACGKKKRTHSDSSFGIDGNWLATSLTLSKDGPKLDLTKNESSSYMLVLKDKAQLYELSGQIKSMRGQKQSYTFNGNKLALLDQGVGGSGDSDLLNFEADVLNLEQNSVTFSNMKMEETKLFATITFTRINSEKALRLYSAMPSYKSDAPKPKDGSNTAGSGVGTAAPTSPTKETLSINSADLDGFWMLSSIDTTAKTYIFGDKFPSGKAFTADQNIIHFKNGQWFQFQSGSSPNKEYAPAKIEGDKIYLTNSQYIDVKSFDKNLGLMKTAPLVMYGINAQHENYRKVPEEKVAELLFANDNFNKFFPGKISQSATELEGFWKAVALPQS